MDEWPSVLEVVSLVHFIGFFGALVMVEVAIAMFRGAERGES